MLHFDYDISRLRGAEYNPRRIKTEDLERLAQSIRTLGLVKPLIARGDLLVAGHQRTKALRHMGETKAPVYLLPAETTTYDEVRFNQLHNGTDMDAGDEDVRITGEIALGYQTVQIDRVSGNMQARLAAVRHEIAALIRKYGPWGGVVATTDGRVIHCAQYALASILTNSPVTVYGIPPGKEPDYRAFLDRQYGVFSYDGLKRDTYIQTFAQMMRLRDGESGRKQHSTLYETMAMPFLKEHPKARAIDFGSGQGDYAKALRKQGFNVLDVELFRRAVGRSALDMRAVNKMIDGMIASLKTEGRFDVVVCDSVMNSVDSLEAESAVLTVLNLLAKTDGALFISGRKLEQIEHQQRMVKHAGKGRWFYQKFHDEETINRLRSEHGFEIVSHVRNNSSTSFQIQARKVADLPLDQVLKACEFEFNMPVGETRTINRHEDVMAAARSLYV